MSPGVPALRTSVTRSGRRVVVRAAGELDLATAPLLRRAIVSAGSPGPLDVVVDLSGVTFVDAAGLGALLDGSEAVRKGGGDLCLSSPSPMLRRMLRLLELEARLPIAESSGQKRVGVPDSMPRSSS